MNKRQAKKLKTKYYYKSYEMVRNERICAIYEMYFCNYKFRNPNVIYLPIKNTTTPIYKFKNCSIQYAKFEKRSFINSIALFYMNDIRYSSGGGIKLAELTIIMRGSKVKRHSIHLTEEYTKYREGLYDGVK